MGPLIIFMAIAIALTYILIRFSSPRHCRLQESGVREGFAGTPDVNTCPPGTSQYFDKNDESRCCDGQVVGRSCVGASVCRLSPSADPEAPPYCADYVAAASFNLKNSQIQNPDTGLCLAYEKNNGRDGILAKKCDGTETWTKNAVGQIVHDKTGLCLNRVDDFFGHFYNVTKCSPTAEQTFTYDYKKNTLQSNAKGAQPLFIQKVTFGEPVFVPMEKISYGEWKSYVIQKNNMNPKDVNDKDLQEFYKMFFSDMTMPARSTFLTLQPSMTDFSSKLQGMFGKK